VKQVRINYTKQALKYLSKLDRPTIQRIKNAIVQLSHEPPEGDIKPLKGQENIYRARMGDYRILFEIDADTGMIMIRKIAPRGEAYK